MRNNRTFSRAAAREMARGFTLVELLVVIVIMAILISAVTIASSALISKSRATNTESVLKIVRDAVEQFHREQKANPTLTRNRAYAERYGRFPPDELEAFTPTGFPDGPSRSFAPRGAVIVPTPPPVYGAMKWYTSGLSDDDVAKEHRDLAAMIVAIELFSEKGSAILDRIQDRYRSPGAVERDGTPVQFLDRPDNDGKLNGEWDSGDLQIRYIIDSWGVPISYMAQRNWDLVAPPAPSSNHDAWNRRSTELIRLNGGQPVIMSYGPNGKEQLAADAMEPGAKASLVYDFDDDDFVNNHLNADNIYADPAFREKLPKGTP